MKREPISYQTISVVPLTPTIGAEVFGIDLSQPLSDVQFEEVHRAWMEHQVIFFRDQKLTIEQHIAFGRRFGELHVHPMASLPGYPEVIEIKADENTGYVQGERWHSDVTCAEKPPAGSILYMHKIPENGGGDTLFSSMYLAYETLSEPIKKLIENFTAIHDGEDAYRVRQNIQRESYPRAEHPVVRTHPVTGRKALFVNRSYTLRIPQLSERESRAVLDMLIEHAELDVMKCRFKWQNGSIAMWDNRCAMHQAIPDYFPLARYAQRVTLAGDKPF
ncbi:MAG: TauD/TfdA family dioxygenase [Proteobacteria bacterium]|nr:TauD/TfdA family dioxygenase [Pseudomonadota bacterium]